LPDARAFIDATWGEKRSRYRENLKLGLAEGGHNN
jgi:hypothetical protein